jgi:hypothetical protein
VDGIARETLGEYTTGARIVLVLVLDEVRLGS